MSTSRAFETLRKAEISTEKGFPHPMLPKSLILKCSLWAFGAILILSFPKRHLLLSKNTNRRFNSNTHENTTSNFKSTNQICEFCALFSKSSANNHITENCEWETPLSDTFCSKKDKGPYAVINPLWGGLHNVWLAAFTGLFFSQVWNETGGTVVLSGNVASRKSFSKEQYAKFIPLEISEVFDTMHIRSYMRETFGVNLCIAKHDNNADPSDFPTGKATYDALKLFSGLNESDFVTFNSTVHNTPGSNASEILKMIPKRNNFALLNIHSWTTHFRYSPPGLGDYNDFHITEMRKSALAMCYSKPVRAFSAKLLSKMYEVANKNKIIGLHLRLEGDWTHDSWSKELSLSVLKEYEEEILSYKIWMGRNVSIYLAHGSLSPDMEMTVSEWISKLNVQVFRKETMLSGRKERHDLEKMTAEVQAAVDAETLVHLDHFIGYCASSMSYVIKERRRYLGKTNYIIEPSFQPGYDFWYPIFVPDKHKYLNENMSPKAES